ncbi:MAG: 6-phosphogluconolactonase, partial [Gammaproteobacteria bacterium]|nr:6-phosphogluconolactonase [Gammaproteobacteria bacterium]
ESINDHGSFHLALAGGSSPRSLYQLLATDEFTESIDWGKVHIYFGDERCVGPDHADSNYLMAKENLLDHVPLPATQVYRMEGERDPTEAASAYASLLKQHLPHADNGAPEFDLILLGMGPDGHTASLFPDTDILNKTDTPVAAVYVDKLKCWRISLTLPIINQARYVMLMVAGTQKADIIRHLWHHIEGASMLPVQRVKPTGELLWMLDSEAARYLSQKPEK